MTKIVNLAKTGNEEGDNCKFGPNEWFEELAKTSGNRTVGKNEWQLRILMNHATKGNSRCRSHPWAEGDFDHVANVPPDDFVKKY